MRRRVACPCVSLLLLVVSASSCTTTASDVYLPEHPFEYTGPAIDVRVRVSAVQDRRGGLEPTVYYSQERDTGNFSRPVASIVEEALEEELERFGLLFGPDNDAQAADVLDLEVILLKCSMRLERRFLSSTLVHLTCSMRFSWRDSVTGVLLEQNSRGDSQTINIGSSTPSLPWNASQIRGFGTTLINSLLPLVIRQEFLSNEHLSQLRNRAGR